MQGAVRQSSTNDCGAQGLDEEEEVRPDWSGSVSAAAGRVKFKLTLSSHNSLPASKVCMLLTAPALCNFSNYCFKSMKAGATEYALDCVVPQSALVSSTRHALQAVCNMPPMPTPTPQNSCIILANSQKHIASAMQGLLFSVWRQGHACAQPSDSYMGAWHLIAVSCSFSHPCAIHQHLAMPWRQNRLCWHHEFMISSVWQALCL